MTFEFNVNALISYLRENSLQPELQKETGQVFIVYKIQQYEIPVFFLLKPESGLLQIVAYLPYSLSQKNLGEAARMLHILNKEMDMPGFGMDESEKLIFYRSIVPCSSGKIDKQLFNMYLGTSRIACDTFIHAIGIIVSGTLTVDEIMSNKQHQTPNPIS